MTWLLEQAVHQYEARCSQVKAGRAQDIPGHVRPPCLRPPAWCGRRRTHGPSDIYPWSSPGLRVFHTETSANEIVVPLKRLPDFSALVRNATYTQCTYPFTHRRAYTQANTDPCTHGHACSQHLRRCAADCAGAAAVAWWRRRHIYAPVCERVRALCV